MEVNDQGQTGSAAVHPLICSECLQQTAVTVLTKGGGSLCGECAAAYYVHCVECQGLIPQDESRARDAALYCQDCYGTVTLPAGVEPLGETEVESLVAEFITLHTEEKRIKDRLEEIKEQLKAAASGRHRVAGAVTLRTDDGAVKCSFKVSWKCDADKIQELERAIDGEQFASLFERKVSYSPVKDSLEKLLATPEGVEPQLREAILGAVEKVESSTLTVVRQKKVI